jgi:Icc-related predicted phosphoesterase
MKILVIADRPPKQNIIETIDREHVDMVCTLGDLDQFQIQDLASVSLPKIGVYGNHCSGAYMEDLGINNMHLTTFEFGGLKFGGFEGSVRYKEDKYSKMYTQEEADALLADFPAVDVMVVHCPPYGVNDEPEVAHQGFKALRAYVERCKPKYLFHGHTYPTEQNMVTRLGETEIVYVQGDKVVEIS